MGSSESCCVEKPNSKLRDLAIVHEQNIALLKLQLEEEKLSHKVTQNKIHSLKDLQQNTFEYLVEEKQITEELEEQLKEIQVISNDFIFIP